MQKSIEKWIDKFVSVHNVKLGTVPCPYARNALINYVKTDDIRKSLDDLSLDFNDDFEVVCLYTPTKNYTAEDLSTIVMEFNHHAMVNDIVALEDHPHDEEIINGAKMNFGKCILVLVQRLHKVNEASDILKEKGYYANWSEKNLNDTVAWRFMG
jgi:hypothetical protein|tara:strand:+ start:69 stop:533 length:465 start_codon:yes stop_codon:yes gene_type:complete